MPSVISTGEDSLLLSRTASSTDGKKARLRVIIAGGSVAGLTLAHCLYQNDIDFVVLEARNEIAPEAGASIVILPNGARVLDQLGIFDDVFAMVEPLQNGLIWTGDGKLIVKSNAAHLIGIRSVQMLVQVNDMGR
jgi:2-polyprenyl-6-methoxyphenol hydroxylase-like FAD-dependent oxidoreductase